MNGWRTLALWTCSAALIALIAEWQAVLAWAEAHERLAAWVQAVFSVLAILASAGLVRWQQLQSDRAAAKSERRAATDVVLMLQYIAAQLKRTNVLANYQLDQVGNPVIYPDIAGEFQRLSANLGALPFAEITVHGQLDTYLYLRRAADELVQLYGTAPRQGDGFYRKNRERLEDLRSTCSGFQLSLAELVLTMDPILYDLRREDMLRL